jgi:hypothetical protein
MYFKAQIGQAHGGRPPTLRARLPSAWRPPDQRRPKAVA